MQLIPPDSSIKVSMLEIITIFCCMKASVPKLFLLHCHIFILLQVIGMTDVVTGADAEGNLHVVTGSKDRSLRLYKVKVLLFYFS